MGKSKKVQKTNKHTDSIDKYLLLGFLSLVILHIIGGYWHTYHSWGFSYWSVLSESVIIFFGIFSIGSILTVYFFRNKLKFDFIDELQQRQKPKSFSILISIIASSLLFFILFIFRSKAHVYGDGFLIIDNVISVDNMLTESKNYMELLTILTNYTVTTLVQQFGGFSSELILGILNSIAGVFGVRAIWSISNLLGDTPKKKIFIFIATLSSASIILFFGYIENYTLALVSGLWTIRFSLGYLKKKNGVFPVLLFSILSIGFHLIALPFLLTALYAILLRSNQTNFLIRQNKLFLSLFFIIGAFLLVLIGQLKGISTFVPLWDIPQNNYSLFTPSHLSDIFNLLLLLSPLGFFFIFISLKEKNNDNLTIDSNEKILFIISLLTFLSACFIDPQLGMLRDWDLLSFYGIPLTLWSVYRFSRIYAGKHFPAWVIIASTIIVIVHIVPNIYEKNNPGTAIEYLDKVLWEDPHYQLNYQKAYRGLSWGHTIGDISGRNDLSEKYYTRRMMADKMDSKPFYNLGLVHMEKNQIDSARYYFQKGIEVAPRDPKFLSKLSILEKKENNLKLAEKYARESIKLDSNHVFGFTALAISLSIQNRIEEALIYFRQAYNLKPDDYESILNLAIQYGKGVNVDSAYYYMTKVYPIAPEKKKPEILGSLITITLYMDRKKEAIEYFNELKSIAPNSPIIKQFEGKIY